MDIYFFFLRYATKFGCEWHIRYWSYSLCIRLCCCVLIWRSVHLSLCMSVSVYQSVCQSSNAVTCSGVNNRILPILTLWSLLSFPCLSFMPFKHLFMLSSCLTFCLLPLPLFGVNKVDQDNSVIWWWFLTGFTERYVCFWYWQWCLCLARIDLIHGLLWIKIKVLIVGTQSYLGNEW